MSGVDLVPVPVYRALPSVNASTCCNCGISTAFSQTAHEELLNLHTACTARTSTTFSESFNCGTVAVLSSLNHPGICRCTQRACERLSSLSGCNCGISTNFSRPAHGKELDVRNRDVDHLINELQLGNHNGRQNWTMGNSLCVTTNPSVCQQPIQVHSLAL